MSKTKIEWTEKTWNPVLGCSKVSEGCRNCYAMSMSARIANSARDREDPTAIQQGYMKVVKQDDQGKYLPKWTNDITLVPERLEDPLRWQKPSMVFVNSMSDLFHPDVPFEFVATVFGIMAEASTHTFQILTKRPDRMAEFHSWLEDNWSSREDHEEVLNTNACMEHAHKYGIYGDEHYTASGAWPTDFPLPNVWLGTSVEDQAAANERIPYLLKCPAAVRFLSCEPLLGTVDVTRVKLNRVYGSALFNALTGEGRTHLGAPFGSDYEGNKINWVIAGGESGHNARPMHPVWVRSLRDQCDEAGVPFFFKQWGRYVPYNQESPITSVLKGEDPKDIELEIKRIAGRNHAFINAGKKKAGRRLDGREWNETPSNHSKLNIQHSKL